ncbi:ATP-binding protein [Flavobacterium plurextorum]|uniref:histidine kinase n=1 Tax=Flavobacterium plurextorum TaxID=1114867 RepID=A0ABX4CNR1_9FLAO|nr:MULTISPECIES: ATP-binding protein [Flavobacterium]OXB00299.1 histidine kinase [Flavobacterium plurextorum]PIF71415.1 signal transduction histidine kinase [Flavobacterium sp. 2]UUW08852.1 ATP-binding protein [Flavobacterium plurextorum]
MVFIRIFIVTLFFISNGNKVYGQQNVLSKKTNTELQNASDKNTVSPQVKLEQLRNKKVVSLFIVLIIILSLLFYFVYQNNKLKQKIRRKDIKQKILLNVINAGIDSQENEQKKIASFLHDNINSLLTSASLHLNVYTAKHNTTSEEISKSKMILAEAHDLLRDMSHDLVPTLLVRFGLIYALEDLCEKNTTSNIRFEFSSSIPTEKRYSEKFEMKLYFIVTELFNNIIKHSDAQKAQISLQEKNEHFIIIIHDNGKGFKTLKLNQIEGFGLNRIRARIKKYKGSFSITSKENNGTTIKIQIPLSH